MGPDKPVKDHNYIQLVESFQNLLSPKRSIAVSQHYFLGIYQKEKQTIPEYVAALQKDITECEFQVKCEC